MKAFYSSSMQGKFNFLKLQINGFLPEMYLCQIKSLLKVNLKVLQPPKNGIMGVPKNLEVCHQDSIRDLLNKLWLCSTEYVSKCKAYLDRSRLAISGSPEGHSIN